MVSTRRAPDTAQAALSLLRHYFFKFYFIF